MAAGEERKKGTVLVMPSSAAAPPNPSNVAQHALPCCPTREPAASVCRQTMMQKRKREAYMNRLSDILEANMERVKREFAARCIQVWAWREGEGGGRSVKECEGVCEGAGLGQFFAALQDKVQCTKVLEDAVERSSRAGRLRA